MKTLSEFVGQLQVLRQSLNNGSEEMNNIIRATCYGVLPEIKTRIHGEGLASDGADIGQYNKTKPLYVNPLNSPVQFTPVGKGQTRAKKAIVNDKRVSVKPNGDKRKTKYFNSYDEFKTAIGRNEIGKVNFLVFGGMQNQLAVIAGDEGFGIGWIPGQMGEENEKKDKPTTTYYERAKFFEIKYGKKIWGLTEAELSQAIQFAQKATNEYIANALS